MAAISVIVPLYNAERTLRRCVDSILCQTYRDLTLILVDDGSQDGSAAICDEYASRDDRVRVIHKENGGVSSARNAGLERFDSPYVTFIDSDDVVPPDYLAVLFSCLNEASADIAVCDVSFLRGEEETLRFSCRKPLMTGTEALERLLSRREINSGPCAKLFRADLIGEERFPPMRAYEDMIFNLRVFQKASRVVSCAAEYRYLDNPQGAMAGQRKTPSEDVIAASGQIAAFLKEHRADFSDEPLYATASHLFSYLVPQAGRKEEAARSFVRKAVAFFRLYRPMLRANRAFPFKEKLLFLLVSHGLLYQNGRISKL